MNNQKNTQDEYISELKLLDSDENILNGKDKYIIPIYQRPFAWGTGKEIRQNEIIQLMDDVMGHTEKSYHLGSLIVSKKDENKFEVIDGQQRLTALFLIFSQLGINVKKECLSYACRASAENILSKIAEENSSYNNVPEENNPAYGIHQGITAIRQKIASENSNLQESYVQKLKDKFKSVVLYRIVVPQNTDLNRYFEIMNTRGEQLEQQDIVKAMLMSNLDNDAEKCTFATIWDACSEMDGYCQMHFHDKNQMEIIFDSYWNNLIESPTQNDNWLSSIFTNIEKTEDNIQKLSFEELIKKPVEYQYCSNNDDHTTHYESIVDFPHFLLHVLNVHLKETKISLDDKKLIDAFRNTIKNFDQTAKKQFSKNFIWSLLKCRFLFDRYFIKRETTNNISQWSLKELYKYKNQAYYQNTTFNNNNSINKDIRMIQSCLRVSYTAPNSMHWITEILKYLNDSSNISGQELIDKITNIARTEVKKFLKLPNYACLGVATPHIVLNYLDYLIWKQPKNHGINITNFEFEFRNSIEHWYPQNPTDKEGCPIWDDKDGHGTVDRLGNLALLQSSINSRFSNLSPSAKAGYESNIFQGSLKLRLMNEFTKNRKNKEWRTQYCEQHEYEMIELLKNDCRELAT